MLNSLIERGDAAAGAVFSECERYRYRLWRVWDASKPKLCFVMLNPSTATHEVLDPTVSRCKKRAEMLGYGGLEVVNIFALRSTDPKALYEAIDPMGDANVAEIDHSINECKIAVCAWGVHGNLRKAGGNMEKFIRSFHPNKIHYLKLNKDGSPAHPLYLDYALKPVLWEES